MPPRQLLVQRLVLFRVQQAEFPAARRRQRLVSQESDALLENRAQPTQERKQPRYGHRYGEHTHRGHVDLGSQLLSSNQQRIAPLVHRQQRERIPVHCRSTLRDQLSQLASSTSSRRQTIRSNIQPGTEIFYWINL